MTETLEKKICGAKTQRGQGPPCRRPPMRNGRCPKHGGKSLSGIAHPNFKTGKHIKVQNLPPRMLDDAQAALNDPELASMRQDIVVLEARINDLIRRVDSGESGEAWRRAQDLLKEYHREQDERRKRAILAEFSSVIDEGVADYDAWDEVSKIMDQRARLVAAEYKRLQINGQMIPVDRALSIIARIMSAVRENVHDAGTLSRIVNAAAKATGSNNI